MGNVHGLCGCGVEEKTIYYVSGWDWITAQSTPLSGNGALCLFAPFVSKEEDKFHERRHLRIFLHARIFQLFVYGFQYFYLLDACCSFACNLIWNVNENCSDCIHEGNFANVNGSMESS